jgi:hypothetical protein
MPKILQLLELISELYIEGPISRIIEFVNLNFINVI